MIPGPNHVYECPQCSNHLYVGSLASGNTFGSEMYSDGKLIAPHLPAFPNFTKCKRCDTIMRLSDLQEIGTFEWGVKPGSPWEQADAAEFLAIEDYFRALDEGFAQTKEMERLIRHLIWWSYNDRVRNGTAPFVDVYDEIKWRDNCLKLISLLNASDLEDRISIADLKRNLGDFGGCMEIMRGIDNDELNELKDLFIQACEKQNRWVFQLW